MSTTSKSSDGVASAIDALLAAYEKGAAGLVELQKTTTAAAAQQNTAMAETANKAAVSATALFKQLADLGAEVQKSALAGAVAQGTSATETATKQFAAAGTIATETFERGLALLADTQKTLLDIALATLKSSK